MDWSQIRLRVGDWSCPIHGRIEPAAGLVPHCAETVDGRPCLWPAHRAVVRGGKVLHVEPRPHACPAGHPLERRVKLGTVPCPCTPVGHHRTWTCNQCPTDTVPLEWPPHNPAVTRPR